MFQPKFNGNVHLANLSFAMFFYAVPQADLSCLQRYHAI